MADAPYRKPNKKKICHSGSVELSPVLKAMAVSSEIGKGAVRFSLGRTTTREEVEQVALNIAA